MSNFTKLTLRHNGARVRVDLDKVSHFVEVGKGTDLVLDNGEEVEVNESFQTVSNRTKSTEAAEPVQA